MWEGKKAKPKKTLHAHLILFLAGFARTGEELNEWLRDGDFGRKFEILRRFLDAAVCHCSKFGSTEISCITCTKSDAIKPVKFSKMAFIEQLQRFHPPATFQCTECEAQYKADDLLLHVVRKAKK